MAMMWMNIWEDEMIYGCDAVWSLFQYKGDAMREFLVRVEKHNLMLQSQMYEDFSADHANKTITMETHPHLPGPPQVYWS